MKTCTEVYAPSRPAVGDQVYLVRYQNGEIHAYAERPETTGGRPIVRGWLGADHRPGEGGNRWALGLAEVTAADGDIVSLRPIPDEAS